MQPTPQLISYIMKHEGFMPHAYLDPKGNTQGKYSIGYGHSIQPGEQYLKGATISQQDAQALLAKDLAYYVGSVNRSLKRPVTQPQFDALVDFAYNDGTGAEAKVAATWNTTGNAALVINQMKQYIHDRENGQLVVNPDLVARRAYEAGLFTGLDHAVASVTAGLTGGDQKKNG